MVPLHKKMKWENCHRSVTPRRISFVHQAFVRIRSMALASQEKLSISPILAVREEKKGRETYKPSVRVYCSFKYNKPFPILGDRKSLTPRCTMTLAISCPHKNTVLQHFNADPWGLYSCYMFLWIWGSKNTENFVMVVLLLDTILLWGVESN